jgi:hypothetical protein
LDRYNEGKPVRERQTLEEEQTPEPKDHALAPSVPSAPARTADF